MATATGRFVSFIVVHIDLIDGPLATVALPPARLPMARLPMALAVSSHGRIDPPPARSHAPASLHQSEDWSDIEALLTATMAVPERASGRQRRHALPLLVSSTLGTATFAGLVAAAYLSAGCGSKMGGCEARTAAKAPVAPQRQAASSPAPAPTLRVAAQPDTDVSQPVVQGRSVDEDDAPKAEVPAVEAAPAASEPRRHRRHHHHRWWW